MLRVKPKIGIEIHAQLLDNLKLFSEAKVDWRAPVNSNVNMFDSATPGSLPHLNWNCVWLALRAARHTNCTVAPVLLFDRKHYGHWDLPAGYQITQKRLPLGLNGRIDLLNGRTINLKQIHLEQDSGKSFSLKDRLVVDLNRAGVALIELVSQPELASPTEAALFVARIHELLQDLEICSGNMEQGVMRVDVNVNLVCEDTNEPVTPRVELKNINGINIIEAAVTSELNRQRNLLKNRPQELKAETRLYSPESDSTILLRVKDSVESYRYLPEYDLPEYPLNSEYYKEPLGLLSRHERVKRFQESHESLIGHSDLLLRLWTRPASLPHLFERCLPFIQDARFLLNWCVGELLGIMNRENFETVSFSPERFAKLVENVRNGLIDKEIAKNEMFSALKDSRDIQITAENKPVDILTDLNREIERLFTLHSDRVQFLKSPEGQQRGSVDFFIGPLMKSFRGKISAIELKTILKSRLFE